MAAEKRTYSSQKEFPRHTLEEALRVPKVVADHYGGAPTEPIDVAASLEIKPTTSTFRTLTGAALAFGLTDAGAFADKIGLTDLGRRAVMPTEEGDDEKALREALLVPRIYREFLTQYDNKKLPPPPIMRNVLIKLGVASAVADKVAERLLASAERAKALQTIRGDRFVRLRGSKHNALSVEDADASEDEEIDDDDVSEDLAKDVVEVPRVKSPPQEHVPVTKPIFVGHGKKKGPLDKLVKVLQQFKIPYKVATGEPHLGRPIPQKVREVMSECGSAILIFTADEKLTNERGEEIWRPSENVVYELGASSFAYEDRVVIFMEEGLQFPANFDSVGRIDFKEDAIEARTMDLLTELVGFGLVKITPA